MRPVLSRPAALRAVRAAIVVPGTFALSSRVLHNPQMATFSAFGAFATLVLASFGGNRKDRLLAHAGLAVTGSVVLVIGTAVNSITAVAAVVTLLVAFCILFAGVASANMASGATAALLAYVLPAASPGTISMVPSRLAGWWLASAAGTLAVMVLYSPPPTDRLRRAAASSAHVQADQLDAALAGHPTAHGSQLALEAKHALIGAYTETPFRPTGLTVADQATASLVEALQWSTTSITDAVGEGSEFPGASVHRDPSDDDRRRVELSAKVLRLTAGLLDGEAVEGLEEAVRDLDSTLVTPSGPAEPDSGGKSDPGAVHRAFHSRLVAAASRTVGLDALIASRRISPVVAATESSRWWDMPPPADTFWSRHPVAVAARAVLGGHTSLRSIWFLNSARGAVALAAAVAVAGVTNVQHGFWVVLGALSVLRTSAASTGATALRALLGTLLGFFIGAGLILAIGSNGSALWAVLPVAVLIAAYAPGTTPFAVGQAAFTVTLSVLYNIIVPVGWKVGELRVEDVALGAAISAVAGVLFWPRGATRVVAQDLADAFHTGGIYLVQATGWALGIRDGAPDGGSAVLLAGGRLDDALRGLLSEQGTQRVPKEVLWRLASGTTRLRLMAHAMARTPRPESLIADDQTRAMMEEVVRIAGLYDQLSSRLGPSAPTVAEELAGLHLDADQSPPTDTRVVWVGHHLSHLRRDLADLPALAETVGKRLEQPWWT